MKRTIKKSIIISNMIIVILAFFMLMITIFMFLLRGYYSNRVEYMNDINISWLNVENNLYLLANRWLSGKPFSDVQENVKNIDDKISNLNKGRISFLETKELRKEIKLAQELWKFTKDEIIVPIITEINDFVVSKEVENLEPDEMKDIIRLQEINYYKKLNLRELIYKNYNLIEDKEKGKYITKGLRIIEKVDLFFSSSEGYSKKVKNTLQLTKDISTRVNRIVLFIVPILIFLQILLGVIFSINNGNRISKPIVNATKKLIDFVGESLERRKEERTRDEIIRLTDSINILLNYYKELSQIATKFSLGDTDITLLPKSEKDVMGNAFLKIAGYLKDLTVGANEIIKGNYNYKIRERSDKDILAKTYNKMSASIVELLEKTKEMTRLESEMEAAAKIQSSILPKYYEKLKGYDIAHKTITATEVGGDSYDFRATRNGNWIAIGDVSGHGLQAGIIALIAQSSFNYGAYLFEKMNIESPEILMYNYVNKTMVLLNRIRAENDAFMTENYLFEKNGVFYCSGAHEIGLLYRSKENRVEELKDLAGNVPFLGIVDNINLTNTQFTFRMEYDDVLLLYTDGLIEAKNEKGEQFDVKRLKEVFFKNARRPVEEIKEVILMELKEFCKNGDLKKYNGSFADDVTILVLRRVKES
ncbi:MAG TPA: SpoIIE family protein phosphatase [Spirochaetota bacterium]|nr:SpoIIE family protein phosphatase [Spirochaetota bacterium]HOL56733.1 SpoIIE family protein phosphatase [Spirochaetota bacterium]HPP04174.1 SpoIIE family protein phosphatase [Spirochaetota bacterium]